MSIRSQSEIKEILSSINWSFSSPFSVGRSGIRLFDARRLHWYPATFIPEIPFSLIEVLTKPGDVVYDPFGGIGTTAFQATLLGRRPYLSELGTISLKFIQSTLKLLSFHKDLQFLVSRTKFIIDKYEPRCDYSKRVDERRCSIDKLRPWFEKNTFNELMYLVLIYQQSRNVMLKSAYWIALSGIVKSVCAQDKGSNWISDNVLPKNKQLRIRKNALMRFEQRVTMLTRTINEARAGLSKDTMKLLSKINTDLCIFREDIRERSSVPDESVDLLVTSPPYPNMTDYALSLRLSYYLLGLDPSDDLGNEIGARRKRTSRNAIELYIEDMNRAIECCSRKVKKGGFMCFVMPEFEGDHNSERRRAVESCLGILPRYGFISLHEKPLGRILPTGRRHHNQTWVTLERESINVYRKLK